MQPQTISGHLLSLDAAPTQPITLHISNEGILDAITPARDRAITLAADEATTTAGDAASTPAGDSEAPKRLLSPAFFDIHCHGAVGQDVMSATPAGFAALEAFLATRGVGSYLPTTVTAPQNVLLPALERIAAEIERPPTPGRAQPLGIHLEGPFLSTKKRGVHPEHELQLPSVTLFDQFQEAARGHIRLITLAPELPGALDLIQHATSQGVRVSLGHTDATAAQTLAAIDAGAQSATHTFNAMRPLDHREPGVLGVTLDDPRLFAELIADRIHVAPAMVRLWFRSKAPHRAILVTDCMQATGRGPGSYTLGGLPVTVTADRALLTGDLAAGKETLAGSILTLDQAVSNLQDITRCTLPEAVHAATATPAALLNLPAFARLHPGQPALINRYTPDGRLEATCLRGTWVQAAP